MIVYCLSTESVLAFEVEDYCPQQPPSQSNKRAAGGSSDTIFNWSDKAYRIDVEYRTSGSANLRTLARLLLFIPAMNGEAFL